MKTTKSHFIIATVHLFIAGCSTENENLDNAAKPIPEVVYPTDQGGENPSSEILYTDIEPDFIGGIQNLSYELDLNNDLLVDYEVKCISEPWWEGLEISSHLEVDNLIICVEQWLNYVIPLKNGDRIPNSPYIQTWGTWGIFTIGNCFAGGTSCFENWKGKGDKYLGLSFKINDDTHYGWTRLQIMSPTEWVIKDYAYNKIPNVPIVAGAKSDTR